MLSIFYLFSHSPTFFSLSLSLFLSLSHFLFLTFSFFLSPFFSLLLSPPHQYVVVVEETEDFKQLAYQEPQAAILQEQNVAVCSIIQLLRTIAVDGFANTQPSTRDQKPVCQVLELVLAASPAYVSPELQKRYQTLVINSIVEHLHVGNEDITIIFRSASQATFSRAMLGLGVFCSRLVDKLWQGTYLRSGDAVYHFLISLVEQAIRQPNVLPLGDLFRCLNRVILFQLATVPSTDKDQKALMETLCKYSGQAHIIFDETNVDMEFLECLTYRLLHLMFDKSRQQSEDSETQNNNSYSYQPMAQSIMRSGANRVWQRMLEWKHTSLQVRYNYTCTYSSIYVAK